MLSSSAIIVWFRRDLRLSDHAALSAACKTGRPVIPLVIKDASVDELGAAPKWRWGLGVEHLGQSLAANDSRLIYRSGRALDVLRALMTETGAGAVYWSRLYDPFAVARDSEIKSELKKVGVEARSFGGHLMFEPWTVETKTGGYYKVYTTFWNSVKMRDVDAPLARPNKILAPDTWPSSENISDWQLGAATRRGAEIVRPHVRLGEAAAQTRLGAFIADKVADLSLIHI